jgi:hypothetical protein
VSYIAVDATQTTDDTVEQVLRELVDRERDRVAAAQTGAGVVTACWFSV